mmetsp:Transcript_7131/g.11556  ORF Transcript_7131/g.11556 Transcript_7131/m.11556 type:complete len:100 (-) Transcript_7131:6-305(-)
MKSTEIARLMNAGSFRHSLFPTAFEHRQVMRKGWDRSCREKLLPEIKTDVKASYTFFVYLFTSKHARACDFFLDLAILPFWRPRQVAVSHVRDLAAPDV